MKYLELFNAVENEYGKELAALVVSAITINLAMKAKPGDLYKAGKYTKRLNKKTRALLWDYEPEIVNLVIEIREAIMEFSDRKTMKGLGGCTEKSLKDIVEHNRN